MYFVASNGIKTSVIVPDIDPFNPRDPDYQDNITKMICWHPRYNLGDNHDFKDGRAFVKSLAQTCLDLSDLCKYAETNPRASIRLKEIETGDDMPGEGYFRIEAKGWRPEPDAWYDTGWIVDKDFSCIHSDSEDLEDLLEQLGTDTLLDLVSEKNEYAILPLYLYDHSGLAMSTGSFLGRALHAEWDSGQVGFIYMDKRTALENLAGIGDEVYVAQPISNGTPITLRNPNSQVSRTAEELLAIHDYLPVEPDRLHLPVDLPAEHPLHHLSDGQIWDGKLLYKKDHRLYTAEGAKEGNAVTLRPIASYNPNLIKLTERDWKARAEEVLRGDVCEYDNYLRGEVYGFQNYEGLEEVDDCWGFNPGPEDIKVLMAAEHSGWYGGEMHYEISYAENFDIERFFEDHDFPELREQIQEAVLGFMTHVEQTMPIPPFEMPMSDIRANQDGVLDQVVESLYENHALPESKDILDALNEHAGIARAVKPKITVSDLNADRDYTAEEVLEILHKRPSLTDLLVNAEARRGVVQNTSEKGLER